MDAALSGHLPQSLAIRAEIAVKPGDSQTILLSAAGFRGHIEEGGLYRTTDGGLTWNKLFQKERD